MIHDDLLKLRTRTGSTPEATATEAGATSTTRSAVTGAAVVDLGKCPEGGIDIELIAEADTGTSNDRTHTITIEASDTVGSGYVEIAKFPVITYADTAAKRFSLTIGTQKRYIRHVITLANANGTLSRIYEINATVGLMDKEA